MLMPLCRAIDVDTGGIRWEATCADLFPEIIGLGDTEDEASDDFCDQLRKIWPVVNDIPVVH